MADAGVPVQATSFRRQVISCTGIEFCRLAVSETKGVAAGIIDHLETHLGDLDPAVRINVNGCPNACAQYQVADIGLQGALAQARRREGDGLPAAPRRPARRGPHVRAAHGQADRRRGGAASCSSASSIAFRDERAADETFGAWIDRQEPGRLRALVGAPIEPRPRPRRRRTAIRARPRRTLVGPAWLEARLDDPTVRDRRGLARPRPVPRVAHPWRARARPGLRAAGRPGEGLPRRRPRGPLRRARTGRRSCSTGTARTATPPGLPPPARGRPPRLRLLDGGRRRWIGEDRPTTAARPDPEAATYPAPAEPVAGLRAQRGEVEALLGEVGHVLVDVRTTDEYAGTATHDPAYPGETAERAGHIPGAVHVPWEAAVREDGSVRPLVELRRLYEEAGVRPDRDVVVYCRIGERASHTWFVLHELLGYPRVRVYDGSWQEWARVRELPIAPAARARGLLGLGLGCPREERTGCHGRS